MSESTVFITGNANKAEFLAKWLGVGLDHHKLELDELQSLDLHEIVEHKARQAHAKIGRAVLVEDVGLRFLALGRLPGPFIKWFLQEMTLQQVCDLLPADAPRGATSSVSYCWFDGNQPRFFDGDLQGSIAASPRGERGFGFDSIFIPDGAQKTHAEMGDTEVEMYGLRTTTVFPALREFFTALDK